MTTRPENEKKTAQSATRGLDNDTKEHCMIIMISNEFTHCRYTLNGLCMGYNRMVLCVLALIQASTMESPFLVSITNQFSYIRSVVASLRHNVAAFLSVDVDDDLVDIKAAVLPIASRWYELGECLRLKASDLEALQSSHLSTERALTEVLKLWLRQV